MAALSAAYEAERRDGEIVNVPVAASSTIYKGGMVCIDTDGYAVAAADTANYVFAGVAVETANNASGADGALSVRVYKTGIYKYTYSGGAAQTNVGETVYIADDNTVTTAAAATNDVACGRVVELVDSTYVMVRIDNNVS